LCVGRLRLTAAVGIFCFFSSRRPHTISALLCLFKEVGHVDAVELSLQIFQQKREVQNHNIVVQLICGIWTTIETLNERRDSCDNLGMRGCFIKSTVFAERLAEQKINKASMTCLNG